MSFMKEILKQNIPIWDACRNTPFLRELQNGTLPLEKFKNYMIQDSIYLKHYARIYGMAVYQSSALKDIRLYYSILSFVTEGESYVRLNYLKQFGLTDDDIEFIQPLPETQNYIRFLLKTAEQGDVCKILMAVLPCMLSYSYIFRKIAADPNTVSEAYSDFISDYADLHYYEDCKRWTAFADEKCAPLSADKKEALKVIFEKASFLELDFWKMAYKDFSNQ